MQSKGVDDVGLDGLEVEDHTRSDEGDSLKPIIRLHVLGKEEKVTATHYVGYDPVRVLLRAPACHEQPNG